MGQVIKINSAAELESQLSDNPNVLIDFYADWCAPCRQLSPVLDLVAQENNDVVICKVNADDNADLSVKYGISSIPAVYFVRNGEVKHTTKGFMGKAQILTMMNAYFVG